MQNTGGQTFAPGAEPRFLGWEEGGGSDEDAYIIGMRERRFDGEAFTAIFNGMGYICERK